MNVIKAACFCQKIVIFTCRHETFIEIREGQVESDESAMALRTMRNGCSVSMREMESLTVQLALIDHQQPLLMPTLIRSAH